MNDYECFKILVDTIHTVIFATVDENDKPVTCAIDIMDFDKDGLYFLTAKGKQFYSRLKLNSSVLLTGIKGEDTLSSVSITINGMVREIGASRLNELFEKNPYMKKIYPSDCSRKTLTVFQIYSGTGECFDLSKSPIERCQFVFGEAHKKNSGYFVGSQCIHCGSCSTVCPQNCIDLNGPIAIINQNNCLHCGNCFEICPIQAIERR